VSYFVTKTHPDLGKCDRAGQPLLRGRKHAHSACLRT
jgi:hypothetical protein